MNLRKLFRLAGLFLQLGLVPLLASAVTPDLSNGSWIKIRISHDGIYKIDHATLKGAGLNLTGINPSNIQMFAFPTGMLPQPNSTPRAEGLQEIAIKISGGEDGTFDTSDAILFYGQGPDKYEYVNARQLFAYENNLYSDFNYYFLHVGNSGKRITSTGTQAGAHPVVDTFIDLGYYETDKYNDLKSGREWFGEQLDTKPEITIRFEMAGIKTGTSMRFVSSLMAQSYEPASFELSWNGTPFLTREMDIIPETTYGVKGTTASDTVTVDAAAFGAPSVTNQDFKIKFTKAASNRSVGYLNYILFAVQRGVSMYTSHNIMTIPSQQQEVSDLRISSLKPGSSVWDVTDPFNVVELPLTANGDVGLAALATSTNRKVVVFNADGLKTPGPITTIANQNIRNISTPSLLIVTHPDFLGEAQRLASHRSSFNGIQTAVVTTEQIYNEFSGGRVDVSAVRDFVRFIHLKNQGQLKNLLLFGRASYDYKDRVFNNTNFVPTYESRGSLGPLETYSSDDYFAFLEEGEGQWEEKLGKDHTMDIGVGRLPVVNTSQAQIVVDKLINYDKTPDPSSWKQRVLFVADDGDFNIHQSMAEDLAESFEVTYKNHHTSKVYLDAFEQLSIPSGQSSPKAEEALNRELNRGYRIVHYTGHGSERVWMAERILDQDTPLKLKEDKKLPLFITATCEFGRYDDPLLSSTAEMLLTRKGGGAIGLVTTTRPVNTITNSILNKAFYAAYFSAGTSRKDLGTIFKTTKNNSTSGVANRNFTLLGDPSMIFSPPLDEAVITSVETSNGSNVLQALSTVLITGEVKSGGVTATDFDGTIELELFDKRSQLQTLGDENSVFTYRLWDHSLFRGVATVVNGEFAFEFVVPQGVSADIQKGKILLYAYDKQTRREAFGGAGNVSIGGVESSPPADVQGPAIELFMADTTFMPGGFTNSNTRLVGRLSDQNGINISGYGNGNISGVLDGTVTFNANDYFVADTDDFTSGTFSYPLNDLEEGHHTIALTVADTYGNVSTATIDFIVGAEGAMVIEDLLVYPNPVSASSPSTVAFRHNRAGEDLEVQAIIFDVLGQVAAEKEFSVPSSTYEVTLFDWDGISAQGTKMKNGIYFVKLAVRSVSDGAKNDRVAKLILTN